MNERTRDGQVGNSCRVGERELSSSCGRKGMKSFRGKRERKRKRSAEEVDGAFLMRRDQKAMDDQGNEQKAHTEGTWFDY